MASCQTIPDWGGDKFAHALHAGIVGAARPIERADASSGSIRSIAFFEWALKFRLTGLRVHRCLLPPARAALGVKDRGAEPAGVRFDRRGVAPDFNAGDVSFEIDCACIRLDAEHKSP
jgi:hypothetical protein